MALEYTKPLSTSFQGEYADRFRLLMIRLAYIHKYSYTDEIKGIFEQEIAWCEENESDEEQYLAYEASIRVLSDLMTIDWGVVEKDNQFLFSKEELQDTSGFKQADIHAKKEILRNQMGVFVKEQNSRSSVMKFVDKMEGRQGWRRSVKLLVTSGEELAERLAPAISLEGEERVAALREAIDPYLQKVEKSLDPTTGRKLSDIWRYFRYTSSVPANSIPGRQIQYLIRDRAHPARPVIGIAALNSGVLELGEDREKFIGLHTTSIVEMFQAAADGGRRALKREVLWLEKYLALALSEVELEKLATKEELDNPSEDVIDRLRNLEEEFKAMRNVALGEAYGTSQKGWGLDADTIESILPPVNTELLAKHGGDNSAAKALAQRLFIAQKRTAALIRFLSTKAVLLENREALLDPKRVMKIVRRKKVTQAIRIVLKSIRTRRAASNMLEATTCVAVPPYNRILGGKLVSLAILSPQISADYRRRYATPSLILSQLRNKPMFRDNTLVYIGTTSVYVYGSSQYNRLSLPAGVISSDQEKISYTLIGKSSGYGTMQFSAKTIRAIRNFMAKKRGFYMPKSLQTSTRSTKMHDLVNGMRTLGFPEQEVAQHRQYRLIYGIPLFPEARKWLLGKTDELPEYISSPEKYADSTERIVEFWRRRWLASRLNHEPSMEALKSDRFVPLGERRS